MNLYDIDHGHLVGRIESDRMISRWGWSFSIEGYAVVDDLAELGNEDAVVGTFIDGVFLNVYGQPMASIKGQLQ